MIQEQTNKLDVILQESALNDSTALVLKNSFQKFMDQVDAIKEKAFAIKIVDPSQKEEMKQAREMRLSVSKARTNADKVRESLKRDALNYNKTVQSAYNLIHNETTEIEKYLKEQEDFIELQEQKRKMEVREARVKMLVGLLPEEPNLFFIDSMTDSDFDTYRTGLIQKIKEKAEAEKKAEEERIAKEKAEAEERQKQQAEIERLKAEAKANEEIARAEKAKAEAEAKKAEEEKAKAKAEAEAEIKKAKAEAEAKVLAERKAKEKLEAEIKARQQAEAKAKAEFEAKKIAEEKAKAEAERRANNAPDREKLKAFAIQLMQIKKPEMQTEDGAKVLHSVETLLFKIKTFINEKVEAM